MPRRKKSEITHEAGVEESVERPYEEAKADPDVIAEIEDRQPDQIADYHETHPTLGFSPPHVEPDPAVVPEQ